MDVLGPQNFVAEPIFIRGTTLTNNTAKTSVGEDLVTIRPAVAEQSLQKKKKQKQNGH